MTNNVNLSTSNTQIHRDKMCLSVINIHPPFYQKTEKEVRLEIAAKLYRVFEKYV